MTTEERIVSEDFVDMIEDASLNYRLEENFQNYSMLKLEGNTSLFYVDAAETSGFFPSAEMFSILPRCYAPVGMPQEGIVDGSSYDLLALTGSGIRQVQSEPLNLTGKGVVLGIIGPGIDYRNPLFRREDGSSRILAIWDQSKPGGRHPEQFPYGTLYSQEDINTALRAENPYDVIPPLDESGYGTTLAALAAGQILQPADAAQNRSYQSAAPDAELVIVRLKEAKNYLKELYCIYEKTAYQENDIMTALEYVRSYVDVSRRAVTALCPLGTTMGNHGGSGALDWYLEEIMGIRNFSVIWCIGDEGNARHHYEGYFRSGESQRQDVELNVADNCPGFMLQFWAEKPAVFRLQVRTPLGESTGIIEGKRIDYRRYEFIYGEGYLTVSYILSEDHSGWQSAVLRFINPLAGIWQIQVEDTGQRLESAFHMWLPMSAFLKENAFFPISSPYITFTSPVTARGVIVSGSSQTESGNYTIWASRGYPVSKEVLPELAAPGEKIQTVLGEYDSSALSAAYVAGAVCQLEQWGITDKNDLLMDGNEMKQYLLRGAERKTDLMYPNRELGYGTLNLSQTFMKMAGITG